ncbi:aldo/keto reductase [Streptomyces chumphonensis]|uniref:aldo/keto reductase n=1 Tax=Streptomyces chumphonensis TaxID=1214925 RepID=UPI00296480AE|nr:aldo/keto reductase [Streptomyces chumphonensis]
MGLGCAGLSPWMYARPDLDDQAWASLLNAAVDLGVGLLDTADVYGQGHNEQLIGQALGHRRSEVLIATKVGMVVDDLATLTWHCDGRPTHLRAAVEASLRRLRSGSVDLCYLHRVDPAVPLEESWGALASMVKDGMIRHLGLSDVHVRDAERAHRIHPVAAIQSELSLWSRAPLGGRRHGEDVVDWCARNGALFVPFSPLGRGFLTGTITPDTSFAPGDLRTRHPWFTSAARAGNHRILTPLREVAKRHDATESQVALAWLLAQGDHVIPIPGTTRLVYMRSNISAAKLTLTPQDLSLLDSTPPPAQEPS